LPEIGSGFSLNTDISLALYYTFDGSSNTNVANYASGSLVYDASLVSSATINTTDYKVGSGRVAFVGSSNQYVQVKPLTTVTPAIGSGMALFYGG